MTVYFMLQHFYSLNCQSFSFRQYKWHQLLLLQRSNNMYNTFYDFTKYKNESYWKCIKLLQLYDRKRLSLHAIIVSLILLDSKDNFFFLNSKMNSLFVNYRKKIVLFAIYYVRFVLSCSILFCLLFVKCCFNLHVSAYVHMTLCALLIYVLFCLITLLAFMYWSDLFWNL